ncbi:MAG: metallophosphoesterase family protein [Kiritimatiellae bacterium]|nr:metallophosphoesterase family protein [Kiritimatiellia bacterium]
MIYAIVSDIHANLQAWHAVLDDMQKYGPDSILCLGDIVGYGPMPAQVLESVCDNVDEIVIGNHDAVVCGRSDSENFNDNAKRVIDWTKNQLSNEAYDFLSGLAAELDGDTFSMAHAELGDPERFDYVESEEMARETLAATDKPIVFIGHTHTSAIFVMDQENDHVLYHQPSNFALLPDMRYIVNVGSVGDPRSADLRAHYCIYDSDTKEVFFRHVPFDIDAYRADMNSTTLPVPPFFMTVGKNMEDYKPTRVTPAKRPIHVRRKKRTTIRTINQELLPWEDASLNTQHERQAMQKQEERKKQLAAGIKAAHLNQRTALEALKNAHLIKKRKAIEEEENKKQRALELSKKAGKTLRAKEATKTAARIEVRRLLEQKKKAESRPPQPDTKDKSRISPSVAPPELVTPKTQPIDQKTPNHDSAIAEAKTDDAKKTRIKNLQAATTIRDAQRKKKAQQKKEKEEAARANARRSIELRKQTATKKQTLSDKPPVEKTQTPNQDSTTVIPTPKSAGKTQVPDNKDNTKPVKHECTQTDRANIPDKETPSTTLSDKQKRIKAIKDAAIAKEHHRRNSSSKAKEKNEAARTKARQIIELKKKKSLEQKKDNQ